MPKRAGWNLVQNGEGGGDGEQKENTDKKWRINNETFFINYRTFFHGKEYVQSLIDWKVYGIDAHWSNKSSQKKNYKSFYTRNSHVF